MKNIIICILLILVLWYQFGAHMLERYSYNKCRAHNPKGIVISNWYPLPGDFALLSIRLVSFCDAEAAE